MKKYLLLFLLTTNVVYAQHMYREAGDNCVSGGQWYHTTSNVCFEDAKADFRCTYCGLYFDSQTGLTTHMKACNYRPRIIFKYDAAGNRTEREIIKYHHGRKIISYNESLPFDGSMRKLMLSVNPVAILLKKDEQECEYSSEGLA